MSLNRIWILGMVFCTYGAFANPTDIQILMTPKNISQKELIKKHGLIRLWPLTSSSSSSSSGIIDVQDSVNLSQNTSGGSKISHESSGVSAKICNGRTYARFSRGVIYSNETAVLHSLLKNGGYNIVQKGDDYLRRKAVAGSTKYGEGQSLLDPYSQLHSRQLIKDMENPQIRAAIDNSTSLVKITDKNRHGRFQIENSNYTIGGWFKPDPTGKPVSLLRKYFTSKNRRAPIVEWEIFATGGNEIYFHGYHDVEHASEMKYLDEREARAFRSRHYDFYGPDDYYADLTEKRAIQDQMRNPKKSVNIIPKIFVDIPIAHKKSKPVPTPLEPPRYPPVVINPPFIEIPMDRPIPIPPYPVNPDFIGWASSGKDHPFLFDMKKFWWGSASNLSGCTDCISPGQDNDLWHFFSISMHLNDPLGPYLDLVIIRDPNERLFGNKATISTHYRHHRFEYDRAVMTEMSRPYLSPVAHSYKSEENCSGGNYCTSSEIELGSVSSHRPFTGYMRGVFISKQALPQTNVTEIAAEFYPMDLELCTYLKPN